MTDAIRVLYVDDEPSLLEIGKLFLEREGFEVDTSESASDALMRLDTERYDAILSDYQMPGMDGILFLTRIRTSGNKTPFIIFTGRGREEVVIEALNNGADFYIQKGGDPLAQFAELSNKIRYAVSRKQSEAALEVSEVLEREMEFHEKELMKFYSQSLDATNRNLKLLSSITRHDIVGQLTVLQLYRELLEEKLPDAEYQEYFKKIGIATERISSIIRFAGKYEEIGINTPIWADVRTIVEAGKKDDVPGQLRLVNDLPAGTEVFADALLVKVLYNLMDNATRYGGTITTIRFSVRKSGDDTVILCEDDGSGVPAEDKERIFDPGFGKNTGFGLALSRKILNFTGITIRETGTPGMGARFEITVPKDAVRIAPKQ